MADVPKPGEVVKVAFCPEHGLHGQRDRCHECGGPCEQVLLMHPALYLDSSAAREAARAIDVALGVSTSQFDPDQLERAKRALESATEPRPLPLLDRLLEFVVENSCSFGAHRAKSGEWVLALEWGAEAPDSPMVGAASYSAEDTLPGAIEAALTEAGAWP